MHTPIWHTDYPLTHLNTFGVAARARYYAAFRRMQDFDALRTQAPWGELPILVLGGGSNLLFTHDYQGLVLQPQLLGKSVLSRDADTVRVRFMAGENWHQCVLWAIDQGAYGLENLSLIPGHVGAAPIQNIGAYGVEVSDYLETVEAIRLSDGTPCTFDRAACQLGYRDSIFKTQLRGQYCITSVTFTLRAQDAPSVSYGAIQEALHRMGHSPKGYTARAVSQAIIDIRRSKLPDPAELGNSGSFFKNPIIPQAQLDTLRASHPDIVHYPAGEGFAKVPAGWLIEHCGWKGKRIGAVGTYPHQALVIVNHGGASGAEIFDFSERIIEAVRAAYGITLEREVNVL